jgi:hypothetical protein
MAYIKKTEFAPSKWLKKADSGPRDSAVIKRT